ncbi:MAG: hypothetical protein FWG37_06030, partial [Clostridia bacterium]|nr:hypothetical protein [Clostridia bacterium]
FHKGQGAVDYATSDGWPWIDARGDISSLDDIPNLYNLRELTLTSQSIADLGPIRRMKLEIICLADNRIGNLLPIKDMTTLQELDVCQNPLRDLTPISGLHSLEKLDISQTQVTNLEPLADLVKLKAVNMAYCGVTDISVMAELPALREVDLSYAQVTDLTPLVKPRNPVTVRCTGIDRRAVDQVRNMKGIIIIEDGMLYASMLTSGTFDPAYLRSAPFPEGDLDFDVPPLHFILTTVSDVPSYHPKNNLNKLPPCMVGFSFDKNFGEGSREAKRAVYDAAKLLAPDDQQYSIFSSGAYESDRWDLFFGLPEEFSIFDCILILELEEGAVAWPLGRYENEEAERRAFTRIVAE